MTVKITEIENKPSTRLLKVEGKLTNGDAETLKRKVDEIGPRGNVEIDLSGLTFIDSEGVAIARRLQREGVRLTGLDLFIKAVIDAHQDE